MTRHPLLDIFAPPPSMYEAALKRSGAPLWDRNAERWVFGTAYERYADMLHRQAMEFAQMTDEDLEAALAALNAERAIW